ncbi:MAG: hypothetical protein JW726_15050 [Anaerolineales bacterium]|nr:hypothetical protein [Anaerolineales bacterium]
MADYQGVKTASALVHTGRGWVVGLVCSIATGQTEGDVIVYDNTSAAGTKIFQATLHEHMPLVIFFPSNCRPLFTTGCYVAVSNVVVSYWIVGN